MATLRRGGVAGASAGWGSTTSTTGRPRQHVRRRREVSVRRGRRVPTPASSGLRRRPGNAASTVPKAMTPPPIHSHTVSGMTRIMIVAPVSAVGQFLESSGRRRIASSSSPTACRRLWP